MDRRGRGHREHPHELRFCRAPDGVRIAYAIHGDGPPLVMAPTWISHLEHDWDSPVWRHYLHALGRIATVIRFNERGHGLSDHEVSDFSLEARCADLSAVIEAAGLDRFALMGMSQSGPVVIRYTVDNPERVTRLVLSGAHATPVRTDFDQGHFETLEQTLRVGWDLPDSRFRRFFSSGLVPSASEEVKGAVDDMLARSTTAEVAIRAGRARYATDVTDLLADVAVPTLVLHARGDRMNDFEEGRLLASHIPGAQFVPLESENHLLLEDEAAWPAFVAAMGGFLEPDRATTVRTASPVAALTDRELEVLRIAAEGLANEAIAARMSVSSRTVERHLSNAYRKLGVSGKSARVAAVAHILSR